MPGRQRLQDYCLGCLTVATLLLVSSWLKNPNVVQAASGVGSEEFLLATGSSSQGGALIFVLNTEKEVLNVYEADGGSEAMRRLTFVASRKISRDLFVTGYNDKSEYSYRELGDRLRVEESKQSPSVEEEGSGGGQ